MPGVLEVLAAVAAGFAGGLAGSLLALWPVRRRVERAAGLLELALRLEARYREASRAVKRLSRRPRARYVVFEVIPANAVDAGSLEEAVMGVARGLWGLTGLAEAGLRVVDYSPATGRGILRVRREYKHVALATLGLLRRVGEARILVIPLAVTGSVKRARRLLTS